MSGISYRKGAVSIFVVVFTALLITVVTVSFVRLMIRDQQRASDSDLSRSAYDSALVGIEDAKRALARYYALDPAARPTNLGDCNGITELLTGTASSAEVPVQTNAATDAALNQAYSCVRVYTQTDDFERSMRADETVLVPLQSTGTFDRVQIEWFIEANADGNPIDVPNSGTSELSTTWPAGRPPVVETQFMQTNTSFNLDQFDDMAGTNSNSNTLFLYPKALASAPTLSFASDTRRTQKTAVTDVQCQTSFSSRYLCTAMITLPDPVGGTTGSRSNAYLRIIPRYRAAQVRVSLYMGAAANPVQFDGAQPRIDSTGRANDLFRRINARVEVGTNIAYPEAAVDVSGNFCKTFAVTDDAGDYDQGACTP